MEYVVPCSTQSQFPYLWSALLQSAHWMPIHGDPGVHEMGIPSRNGAPREHNWEPPPTPATIRPPPLATQVRSSPGAFPAAKVTREHNWDPSPRSTTRPRPCLPGWPRPWRAPGASPGLPVSPAPTPVSRRGSRTSFTYFCQVKHEDK